MYVIQPQYIVDFAKTSPKTWRRGFNLICADFNLNNNRERVAFLFSIRSIEKRTIGKRADTAHSVSSVHDAGFFLHIREIYLWLLWLLQIHESK